MMESFLDVVGFLLVIGLLLLAPMLLGAYLFYHLVAQALLPSEKRFSRMTFADIFIREDRKKLAAIPSPQEKPAYASKKTQVETPRTERPRRFGT